MHATRLTQNKRTGKHSCKAGMLPVPSLLLLKPHSVDLQHAAAAAQPSPYP